MSMLCFVLDLRSLSPSVLRDLKQSLLQLGNYYAVSSSNVSDSCDRTQLKPLLDRIGLCYVFRDRISCCDELKIAYKPQGNFNLRDFHHAVNNLPVDAFLPESNDSAAPCKDLKLADVLSEKVLYAWRELDKSIFIKVILISSCPVDALDSMTLMALMDAANKSVFVEFVFLEQALNHMGGNAVKKNNILEQTGSLKNLSFQSYLPDLQVLFGLVKRWFQELKDDDKGPLQACFVFKTNLTNSTNQISCNLFPSYNSIVDGFNCCQTCRCHGVPLDSRSVNKINRPSCPVTYSDLESSDVIENSIKVGKQTILYMPSFLDRQKLLQVSSPIMFNVIQRTNLGSLSEGLIMGGTHFVAPVFHNSSAHEDMKYNSELFQIVSSVLNSLDQGLVCSSNCNIETSMETSFPCYYILFPSDKGLMLLRRLSASEEFLAIFDVHQFVSCPAVELVATVEASLLKMELGDYNPVLHERGFHQKLNLLVKESLQFGVILPKSKEGISESDLFPEASSLEIHPLMQPTDVIFTEDETQCIDNEDGNKISTALGENCLFDAIEEEWNQILVTELGGVLSPTCISNSKLDQVVTSPTQSNKQLDERTSRILERLEAPAQLSRKSVSPTISTSSATHVCTPAKKPLIPYRPSHCANPAPMSSQLLKPNFPRLKRKR